MLYSLVAAVVILAFFNALIVPFIVVQYFLKGYNINAEVKVTVPTVKNIVKRTEKPKIDEKTAALLRNIDRYDGTSGGQEVI
ncbi:hypothetical protein D1155_10120 [Anaerotruncus sp. 80]|uniref:Uncharacterized protein n=1 Tax=Anaerotruncus colihominis TaxID=169435 RepID=A0A845QKP3_9FIRM|nr:MULTISPECIES: hypothetical protein [Anaerotruncus]NBH62004.1 hypothetical protein [Anaerotruncus colihominis]NCF02659.1 hypothetical protein [Anaerotruncus sp. 80]